jgi:hypothetical protein
MLLLIAALWKFGHSRNAARTPSTKGQSKRNNKQQLQQTAVAYSISSKFPQKKVHDVSQLLISTNLPTLKPFTAKFVAASALSTILFLLGGCAELPLVVNAADAISYAVLGAPDTEIDRKAIKELPYASISAKIGSGPRSFLVLGKQENGMLHWFSADHAVIVTKNGRIVQTAGFPDNLKSTFFTERDPVNRKLHKKWYGGDSKKLGFARNLDLDYENRFGVPVRSKFETIGPVEIEIADIKLKTILVKETNNAFGINWSFTNYYWVDAFDGYIWKSIQHVARSFPPINIEVLKPAG